jgi:flagellar FliL protein
MGKKETAGEPETKPVAPPAAEAAPAPQKKSGRGILLTAVAFLLVTLVAGGAGGGLGMHLAAAIEKTVRAKIEAAPAGKPELRYSGDMVVEPIEPVVTNLGDPTDTWIRLETAIVFANGALPDPKVTAAEIRQDIVAYARTLSLSQLEGASALQHLREDLNERVATRTNGQVSELIIETMVVQ